MNSTRDQKMSRKNNQDLLDAVAGLLNKADTYKDKSLESIILDAKREYLKKKNTTLI